MRESAGDEGNRILFPYHRVRTSMRRATTQFAENRAEYEPMITAASQYALFFDESRCFFFKLFYFYFTGCTSYTINTIFLYATYPHRCFHVNISENITVNILSCQTYIVVGISNYIIRDDNIFILLLVF